MLYITNRKLVLQLGNSVDEFFGLCLPFKKNTNLIMNQAGFETESGLMKFYRKLHLDSIAWSLRRVYCPVSKDALVLEVGIGSSPYFRANVLCDTYEETQERFFAPLTQDRPAILAFGESLPFKDDAFDFVIASHVLEHSMDLDKFLSELQRVS